METQVKQLIAPFIGVGAEEITGSTPMDRNALKSSIHLHRMYAKLASNGYAITDYSNINKFATLMNKLGNTTSDKVDKPIIPMQDKALLNGVGIDIVDVSEMPEAQDFRAHEFYLSSFTANEISYCILQSNPYASFAGLFAAKEAIVKANNNLLSVPFTSISIDHNENGKPYFSNFDISISHTENTVVAVAIIFSAPIEENSNELQSIPVQSPENKLALILSGLSIIIAIVSIIIAYKMYFS